MFDKKEYSKAYYLLNKEKIKLRANLYHKDNRENVLEKKREYNNRTRDRRIKYLKEYHKRNKDKAKEYREKNKNKKKEYQHEYRKKNKQVRKIYLKKWYSKNETKKSEYDRKYRLKNEPKLKEKRKEYKKKNKHRLREKHKQRMKSDVNYMVSHNLRLRMRLVVKRNEKIGRMLTLLGCTVSEFKKYIESKFKDGMSWENYGVKGWHFDHIIPCNVFDLTKGEAQKVCFHYTNYQPLWCIENIKKGYKVDINVLMKIDKYILKEKYVKLIDSFKNKTNG